MQYDGFLKYIFANEDLNWDAGPGIQGAYKSFYLTKRKTTHGNFLPFRLNWNCYWEPNDKVRQAGRQAGRQSFIL